MGTTDLPCMQRGTHEKLRIDEPTASALDAQQLAHVYCALLQQLSLAGNNLTHLPPGIGRLTALQRLQLSGNLFESLPEELGQLTRLQVQPCVDRRMKFPDGLSQHTDWVSSCRP
jgi:Leucine rich repeat